MKKILILLLFPLFVSSQIDTFKYYRTNYKLDTLVNPNGTLSIMESYIEYLPDPYFKASIIETDYKMYKDVSNQYLYRIDTTIDTIPVIITFIDYDYALNIVKYVFGYEVQLIIKDNYPIPLSTFSNNYVHNSYLNVANEVVQYLDIDKNKLPENYKVLQTYKR